MTIYLFYLHSLIGVLFGDGSLPETAKHNGVSGESKSLSPFLLSSELEFHPRPSSHFVLLLLKYLSITITAANGTRH